MDPTSTPGHIPFDPDRRPAPARGAPTTRPRLRLPLVPRIARWLTGTSIAAGLVLPAPAQIQPQPVTIYSVAAPAPNPFPGASGDFEFTAVPAGGFLYGPNFPGGSTAWTPWTMGTGTGIAANGSGFTAQNPPAPAPGTRVALVQGFGSMSTPYTFGRGSWRLRFQGAQRHHGGTNRQVLRIVVGSTEVFEQELVGENYTTYTTRPIWFGVATGTTVTIQGLNPYGGDNTAFVDKLELERLGDWADANAWSPAIVPTAANPVVIVAGTTVTMRGTMQAANVTVNGELLAAPQTGQLDAGWVMVSGSGSRFEVGRELSPFEQMFTLQLNATDPNENVMNAGTKFLMAMDGGVVDLHGLPKRSWTKLTSLAIAPVPIGNPPAMWMTVDDHGGWQVGDEVVVAYTGHVSHTAGWSSVCGPTPYDGPKSQTRAITAIDQATGRITLAGSLALADHCVAPATQYTNPTTAQQWTLDQRAEVGMLSHNVRVRGTATTTGFGAHVMIMSCCTLMPTGFGRLANVELTEVGQKQQLGRYPMHWHMVRSSGDGQYIRDCSVHHSYNRAITMHGTHDTVVERNVCFDIVGHAVFLEDGVEHGNAILGNLVLGTRKPAPCEQMLPHDNSFDQPQNRSPASFWISRPDNTFVGNVAADSLGVGYWFALHQFPTGLSSTANWLGQFGNVDATGLDLGTFADNVAHSIKLGIDVHDSVRDAYGASIAVSPCIGGTPNWCTGSPPTGSSVDDPRDDDILTNKQWQPVNDAVLTGFVAYGCTTGLYSGGGIEYVDRIKFDDCVLADNGVHVHFASGDTVRNSVLVHDSGHLIFPTGTAGPHNPTGNGMPNGHLHGFEHGNAYVVYDGPGQLNDCYLVGYDTASSGNLVYSNFGAARRHPNHLFSGLTFAGSGKPRLDFADFTDTTIPAALQQPFVWGIVLRDQDGSLTQGVSGGPYPGWSVISNHPMLHLLGAGTTTPDVSLGGNAWLSPFTWAHLQVRYYVGTNLANLLEGANVPTAKFTRDPYLSWDGQKFFSDYTPAAQMRQMPVLVRPAGSTATECQYELEVYDPTPSQSSLPLHRVDVSIDDAGPGVVTRLRITHATQPNWVPVLYVNDLASQIHSNGQNPNNLTPMTPGTNPVRTAYTIVPVGTPPSQAIDLRLVNPNRTHRISIVW